MVQVNRGFMNSGQLVIILIIGGQCGAVVIMFTLYISGLSVASWAGLRLGSVPSLVAPVHPAGFGDIDIK